MTGEELRAYKRAQPFRPFRLNLADRRRIPVLQKELFQVSPNGQQASFCQSDDTFTIVDVIQIRSVEFLPPPQEFPQSPGFDGAY